MSSSFKRRGKKATVRPATSPPPSSFANADASTTSVSSSAIKHGIRSTTDEHSPSSSTTTTTTTTTSSHQQHRTKTISSSLLPGTKPWTNNLTLTSFGLREIDSFFFSSGGGGNDGGSSGGGQPLQTFVVLEEDRLADDLARALCRYWCGEGVAQRQLVLLGGILPSTEDSLELLDNDDDFGGCDKYEGSTPEELRDFVMSLPRNLHLDRSREREKKKKKKGATATASTATNSNGGILSKNRESISAIIEEEEEEEEAEDDDDDNTNHQHVEAQNKDEGLVNAWQYRKSIQDARSGIGNRDGDEGGGGGGDGIYCHSYDLSKRMWDQFDFEQDYGDNGNNTDAEKNPLVTNTKIVDCSRALWSSSSTLRNDATMEYQQQGMALFCSLYKHLQTTLSSHPNTVIRLFLHRLPIGQGAIAMPLLMSKIRKENLPVVVLATARPWKWLSSSPSSNNNYGSSNNDAMNKLDALSSLRTATDVTLSLDSFSSFRSPPPPEFSLLQGVLTVRKCASFHVAHYTDAVTWKRPLAERFGVKRDGRKVTVQLLHLPPEEYSKGGSSTSGVRSGGGGGGGSDDQGQGRSGGGRSGGCSSVGGGASLDF